MKNVAVVENRYLQREKALKHYIGKLRNALKMKKGPQVKKDKDQDHKRRGKINGDDKGTNENITSKRKRSNARNIFIKEEPQPAKTLDPSEWNANKLTKENKGRQNTSGRKRNKLQKNPKAPGCKQVENEIDFGLTQRQKKFNSYKKENHARRSKHLMLHDIYEHPMLKQELVAEINGECIQFHLVNVDPKLLFQEQPVVNAEPIPSLIWPYD